MCLQCLFHIIQSRADLEPVIVKICMLLIRFQLIFIKVGSLITKCVFAPQHNGAKQVYRYLFNFFLCKVEALLTV